MAAEPRTRRLIYASAAKVGGVCGAPSGSCAIITVESTTSTDAIFFFFKGTKGVSLQTDAAFSCISTWGLSATDQSISVSPPTVLELRDSRVA